jgi:hypothetical protein
MPQMLIGAGLSAVQGLLGGNKQKQNQTSTNTTDKTFEQSQEQSSNQQRQFEENPLLTAAREALIPILGSEFNKAQKPVYGQAHQANFMNSLNELAQAAMQRMTQGVAGSGGMRSGRFAGGTQDIERQRMGDASKFFANLPMLEEQARSGKVNNLLGLASQWLGTGPVNETVTGQAQATSKGNEHSVSTGNQQTTGSTGGGASGALGNLIGFGGGVLGDFMSGQGSKWGFGGSNRPDNGGVKWGMGGGE